MIPYTKFEAIQIILHKTHFAKLKREGVLAPLFTFLYLTYVPPNVIKKLLIRMNFEKKFEAN